MSRHVSAETLALHREGAVSARKAASISSHLSGCSRCARVDSGLAAVSSVLAGTQLPPMPSLLVERLQMVIASEAAERTARSPGRSVGAAADAERAANAASADEAASAAGADEAAPAYIPGRPDLPVRTRRTARRPRMPGLSSPLLLRGLAAAGAVVIIAGAGFLLARGQTSLNTTGGSGAGSARPTARGPLSRPAAGHMPISVHYRRDGKILTATALASNTDYSRATLAPLVRQEVASSTRFGVRVEGQPTITSAPEKQLAGMNILRLEACLNRVAAGRKVLLADVARYVGKPAMIIVLSSLKAVDVFDVAVVRLSCSASSSQVIVRETVPAG